MAERHSSFAPHHHQPTAPSGFCEHVIKLTLHESACIGLFQFRATEVWSSSTMPLRNS